MSLMCGLLTIPAQVNVPTALLDAAGGTGLCHDFCDIKPTLPYNWREGAAEKEANQLSQPDWPRMAEAWGCPRGVPRGLVLPLRGPPGVRSGRSVERRLVSRI